MIDPKDLVLLAEAIGASPHIIEDGYLFITSGKNNEDGTPKLIRFVPQAKEEQAFRVQLLLARKGCLSLHYNEVVDIWECKLFTWKLIDYRAHSKEPMEAITLAAIDYVKEVK